MTSFNERDQKITTSHEKKGFTKYPYKFEKNASVTHILPYSTNSFRYKPL